MKRIVKVFGAPGCGKTHYVLSVLDKLLKKYEPNEIAYVSFTRKGAYEGRDRAIEQFGFKASDFPYFKTLHAIAFKDAGFTKSDVIQKRHYKEFSDAMHMRFTGYYTEDFSNNDDQYMFQHFLRMSNEKLASTYEQYMDVKMIDYVSKNYIGYKKQYGLIDFTDMILQYVIRGAPLPVKVAIIDEAQDLTTLQWDMCKIAFKNCNVVYVAGDDDQAIYQWQGADIDYFLRLKGEQIILDKSYRLPSKILNFAKQITQHITTRVDKDFKPFVKGGNIYYHDNLSSIEINEDETYYLLSRNNYFLKYYTEWVRDAGRVYQYKGKKVIDTRLVTAINDYERFRRTGLYETQAKRVTTEAYMRKDVQGNPEWYNIFAIEPNDMTYYRSVIRNKRNLDDDKIQINTVHGVKGGEADNIVLVLDVTRAISRAFENATDSELRCLYVACTRAKKNLHIVFSQTKRSYDELLEVRDLMRGVTHV